MDHTNWSCHSCAMAEADKDMKNNTTKSWSVSWQQQRRGCRARLICSSEVALKFGRVLRWSPHFGQGFITVWFGLENGKGSSCFEPSHLLCPLSTNVLQIFASVGTFMQTFLPISWSETSPDLSIGKFHWVSWAGDFIQQNCRKCHIPLSARKFLGPESSCNQGDC